MEKEKKVTSEKPIKVEGRFEVLTKKSVIDLPKATHKGNFEKEFGIDLECYVLDDQNKTVVISQRGMASALGLDTSSGSAFPIFLNSQIMQKYLGEEIREKMSQPLIFKPIQSGGIKNANGQDITLLIDVCRAVLSASANREKISEKVVKQANIILGASAKTGIKALGYALAGYNPTAQEIIDTFKLYVREEAREYEKEFPDELYLEWYRIYKIEKPKRGKSWKFKHLTIKQVYYPLAGSKGAILKLAESAKNKAGGGYIHSFLSAEVGVKALRTHLGKLVGIAQLSKDEKDYENNLKKVFGNKLDDYKEQLSLDYGIEKDKN
ncbi:MAG: P63C domain-containing protein [Fusobacteriaceae bacterium]